ncbi:MULTISPECIES: undecaprenyl-diphosphate phosphatase [unclassified Paenibacillus]|uniref:undecaprenyl-diphosphate phosphatase n=1 Tax=unclassified Paenibacillus TaxID=185978 RepID=UPI001AE7630D|nr:MULTISPECIES: undecaprenyl-diphosphate phosphatase [unclassified Paenibacillus]MBP1154989.1 undecaprenyl-diphosphatase [Paenibacillus sp. PvP091]MBP1169627.1 undecaprenyl-diphosphatase [Paenibacillus sp. PvR098]MBP2440655.1 undecaprenyl-diphosphatase [Paenibacillus sp. PvP052]
MEDFLIVIKYGLLGLLQGLTEPIPISSSGHLMIAQHLFGLHIEGLSFAVFVNFASLLAVLLIYKEDIRRLAVNGWRYIKDRSPDAKSDFLFIMYLILATIPAGFIGILLKDYISEMLEGLKVIGVTLLVTGIALWLIRNLRGRKQDADLTWKDALIVGLAQAVALIPGISRSGATIVAAMGIGMKQETALRFSFFLYIPISIGGMVLEGGELLSDPNLNELIVAYIVAFVLTFIATYYSLKWFMGIMARGNLKVFSIYCFVAGTAVLLFL